MKTKILLLGFCLTFGLSNAKAEFEPINQDNPKNKFLVYADFGQTKPILNIATHQFRFPIKSNVIDKESHEMAEQFIHSHDKFSQIWLVGKVMIDCDNQEITPYWQMMGIPENSHTSVINISQKYHIDINDISLHKIDFNNKTENLIFQKACKLNPTLKK